jgi:UDP-N-acetylmuramate dehydrogenase
MKLPPSFEKFARYNEPMAERTTFKVGGSADVYIRFDKDDFAENAAALLAFTRSQNIPLFILGGGANIVVADAGIRGIVLDTKTNDAVTDDFVFGSGVLCDEASEIAAGRGLGGLEFLAGLPGTIGGAVWMNARCWEKSVSDVLSGVTILDEDLRRVFCPFNQNEWDYKLSPFQKRDVLILSARFNLQKRPEKEIPRLKETMARYRSERERKGHFRYPSAGSVFKNNRDFGQSTGKIIEELGLRGMRIGGAGIADWHGNFIINIGGAKAADIRALVAAVQNEAKKRLGITLESEILFVGEWDSNFKFED